MIDDQTTLTPDEPAQKAKPRKRAKSHPGTFEDVGEYRRLILYVDGKRYTFKCPSKDRKACEKFAREKKTELVKQLDDEAKIAARGATRETRFSDLYSLFVREELPILAKGTQRAYRDSLLPIREYFVDVMNDPTLDEIRRADVKSYLSWRRVRRRAGKNQEATSEPLGNRTLQKDFVVLQRLFNVAVDRELAKGSPVRGKKDGDKPAADPRSAVILSDEQYESLLAKASANPQLWLYVLALGETGGRCYSEILHLQWDDIDLVEKTITIRSGRDGHRTKSGESRHVPMSDRLHVAFRAHSLRVRGAVYHEKTTPWVFHHERDRRNCLAGQRMKSFRAAFDIAQEAAGIPDEFHRHDLRHRRATSLIEAGANIVDVKDFLGHSDVKVTMGYIKLTKKAQRDRMSPFLNPQSTPATPSTTEKHA